MYQIRHRSFAVLHINEFSSFRWNLIFFFFFLQLFSIFGLYYCYTLLLFSRIRRTMWVSHVYFVLISPVSIVVVVVVQVFVWIHYNTIWADDVLTHIFFIWMSVFWYCLRSFAWIADPKRSTDWIAISAFDFDFKMPSKIQWTKESQKNIHTSNDLNDRKIRICFCCRSP